MTPKLLLEDEYFLWRGACDHVLRELTIKHGDCHHTTGLVCQHCAAIVQCNIAGHAFRLIDGVVWCEFACGHLEAVTDQEEKAWQDYLAIRELRKRGIEPPNQTPHDPVRCPRCRKSIKEARMAPYIYTFTGSRVSRQYDCGHMERLTDPDELAKFWESVRPTRVTT